MAKCGYNNLNTKISSPLPENKQTKEPGPNPPTPPKSPENSKTMPKTNTNGRATPQLKVDTGAGAGPSTSTAAPPTSIVGEQTAKAVNGLLYAMQQSLSALGTTFDILGEQTISVATLGPAVDAVLKIESVRKRVNAQREAQNGMMQQTQDKVKEQVAEIIRDKLRPQVDNLVADAVARLVQDRVRDELRKQVSQTLKDELEEHRLRILEVKIALANAEAQRHNALIPREAVNQQPLRPLLRPFAAGAPLGTPAGGAANGDGDGQAAANANKKDAKKKNGAANGNGAAAASTGANGAAAAAPAGAPAGTASEVFPRYVHDLPTMDARRARQLVVDYGLVAGDGEDDDDWDVTLKDAPGASGKKGGTAKDGKKNETPKEKAEREKEERESKKEAERREVKLREREIRRTADLNDFMRFIGLGHLVLLHSPPVFGADGAMVLQSPLIERPSQAFRLW